MTRLTSLKQSFADFTRKNPMLGLAAALQADEISPDVDVQIAECQRQGVTHVELRGAAGKNVLDFDKSLRAEIKQKLADNGLRVIGIGSPIGKIKLSEPFEPHFEKFKLAVELAEFFDAPLLRIFSYYEAFPQGRAEVRPPPAEKNRLHPIVPPYPASFVHENERHIYGELGAVLPRPASEPRLLGQISCCLRFRQLRPSWRGPAHQLAAPGNRTPLSESILKTRSKDGGKVVPAKQKAMVTLPKS